MMIRRPTFACMLIWLTVQVSSSCNSQCCQGFQVKQAAPPRNRFSGGTTFFATSIYPEYKQAGKILARWSGKTKTSSRRRRGQGRNYSDHIDPNETDVSVKIHGGIRNVITLWRRKLLRKYAHFFVRFWSNWKAFWRSKIEKYTIYVLQCEEGKYYVGSTSYFQKRMKQHSSAKGGSVWTKRYKPVRVLKEYKRVPAAYHLGLEAQVTAQYMLEHGVNNVRGAMFAQVKMYTQQDLDALVGFLGHYNDLKYGPLRDVLQQTLPPAAKKTSFTTSSSGKSSSSFRSNRQQRKCFSCNKHGHIAADCPDKDHHHGDSDKVCFVCGQLGHISSNCIVNEWDIADFN
eukprot:CAMPEP_0198143048 /NCGR_PEP_ID=MMETSP1443-20131203/5669_1 /TAXON_ID=186043 /ORGANISM="Entomoneis sp., Strain CCMP2396" /LENGTH=342 /DNA_ID=CAMNT_0043806185 /DNA_START=248 /DNA_END=1276 /DNA_ORIENTATION=-